MVYYLISGSEVEEKVMSMMRERIPLAATQPVTDTQLVWKIHSAHTILYTLCAFNHNLLQNLYVCIIHEY